MTIVKQNTDYAVRALVELGQAQSAMSCGIIAKKCQIPKSFAHKILKKLTQAGILTSQPGRSGGFCLKSDPKEISLARIARAVQGDIAVRQCVIEPKACRRSSSCPLWPKWQKLQQDMTAFLDKTTLHTLLSASKALQPCASVN